MNGFNKIVDDSSDEYILNQIAEYCGSEKVISNFVKSKIENLFRNMQLMLQNFL